MTWLETNKIHFIPQISDSVQHKSLSEAEKQTFSTQWMDIKSLSVCWPKVEEREVEAIYYWHMKHPVAHAIRKRTFWNAGRIFHPIIMSLCMKLAFTIATTISSFVNLVKG